VIIATSGKGSMGKTTFLIRSYQYGILDSMVMRMGYDGVCFIDLDPYMILSCTLRTQSPDIPDAPTVADLRQRLEIDMASGERPRVPDGTPEMLQLEWDIVQSCIARWNRWVGSYGDGAIGRSVPSDAASPSVIEQTNSAVVTYRLITLGTWTLGGSQCTPNNTVSRTLAQIVQSMPRTIFLIDNPAGIEPFGRYANIPPNIYLCFGNTRDLIQQKAWAQTIVQTFTMAWRTVLDPGNPSALNHRFRIIAIPSPYRSRKVVVPRETVLAMIQEYVEDSDIAGLIGDITVIAPPFVQHRQRLSDIWEKVEQALHGVGIR